VQLVTTELHNTTIAKDAFSVGGNSLMEACLKTLAPSNVAEGKL
jgi:hypothetical protein